MKAIFIGIIVLIVAVMVSNIMQRQWEMQRCFEIMCEQLERVEEEDERVLSTRN